MRKEKEKERDNERDEERGEEKGEKDRGCWFKQEFIQNKIKIQ